MSREDKRGKSTDLKLQHVADLVINATELQLNREKSWSVTWKQIYYFYNHRNDSETILFIFESDLNSIQPSSEHLEADMNSRLRLLPRFRHLRNQLFSVLYL